MQEWNATKRSYVMRAPFGNAACSRSVTSISGATSEILSNSIFTQSRTRPSTSPVVACVISYFFRPRRPIVIKHDCQSTAHEERTERRNSYLKENFFKIGSFKSKEKCENRTPRSVRMSCVLRLEMQRAPEASHQSAAQQAKSFQIRFSRAPHATIYKPRCCLCDFVFFSPAQAHRHQTRLSIDSTRGTDREEIPT